MTRECEWRHPPEACAEDFWDLRKVSKLSSCLGRRRLTFAARRGLAAVAARGWADEKVVIERLCLCLPYVEKPFNSKVIISFIPELRSRQVFFVFRDSYVIYIYELWTFYVHFTYPYHGYVTCIKNWYHLRNEVSGVKFSIVWDIKGIIFFISYGI